MGISHGFVRNNSSFKVCAEMINAKEHKHLINISTLYKIFIVIFDKNVFSSTENSQEQWVVSLDQNSSNIKSDLIVSTGS